MNVKPCIRGTKIAIDIGGVILKLTRHSTTGDHTVETDTQFVKYALDAIKMLKTAGYDTYVLSYCGQATEDKSREKLKLAGVHESVNES